MSTNIKKYQLNNEMVWMGDLFKIDGKIQSKPTRFVIRPLNVNDAEQMGELSQKIYSHLKDGEECFIHKHSKEYYYDVFENPNIHYIGVFVGKNLVGMSYLKICQNKEELQEELPNSNYDFFRNNNLNTRIASFGADSVLPSFRGNSLNAIMIDYRFNLASNLNCTDCTSIVDRNNRWNMTPYFANRFNLFSTAIDPSDNGKISLLHKPMGQDSVLSNKKTRISIPYNRFELIDKMISRGFVGVDFDKTNASVTFAHSSFYVSKEHAPANILDFAPYRNVFSM